MSSASTPTPPGPRYFATVPPQEILPIVNSRFESSVRGIYVIGDVTGLPLVKVAANQGVDWSLNSQASWQGPAVAAPKIETELGSGSFPNR